MAKVAVIYYSATGNVHRLAKAVGEGVERAGGELRLRHVAELAPESAIAQNEAWVAHRKEVEGLPLAEVSDFEWADAYILGTPTRFGNVSSQLKQLMDQTGGLWVQGKLANKPAAGFTSSINRHGGQESTLLALYNTLYHWGAIIVPVGYTHELLYASGGNPYGISSIGAPDEEVLEGGRYLGERVTRIADKLLA